MSSKAKLKYFLLSILVTLLLVTGFLLFAPTGSSDRKYVLALFGDQKVAISNLKFKAAGFQDTRNFYRFNSGSEAIKVLMKRYNLSNSQDSSPCGWNGVSPTERYKNSEVTPDWWNFEIGSSDSFHGSNTKNTCCYYLFYSNKEQLAFFEETCG